MILITKSFEKLLSKIKSISLGDIKLEILKHNIGLNNFIDIGTINNRKVLKGYLLNKKVRILILFQEKNGKYLPFYIVKKETKNGKNIRKESISDLDYILDKTFDDLKDNNYKIIDLK